jgi:hypothetical protein
MVDGALRLSWGDKLELYTLPMLGHGTPIHSADIGTPAPFVVEAGISSSRRIAAFWGLAQRAAQPSPQQIPVEAEIALPAIEAMLDARVVAPRRENLILRALKAAGLVRKS